MIQPEPSPSPLPIPSTPPMSLESSSSNSKSSNNHDDDSIWGDDAVLLNNCQHNDNVDCIVASASAPGKLILFGEHAVVYGQPAVAVSLSDLRIYVQVRFNQQKQQQRQSRPGQHRNNQNNNNNNQSTVTILMPDLQQPVSVRVLWKDVVALPLLAPPTAACVQHIDTLLLQQQQQQQEQPTRGHGGTTIEPLSELGRTAVTPVLYLMHQLIAPVVMSGRCDDDIDNDNRGVTETPSRSSTSMTTMMTTKIASTTTNRCDDSDDDDDDWVYQRWTIVVRSPDLPVGAGLGSSAALGVACAAAMIRWTWQWQQQQQQQKKQRQQEQQRVNDQNQSDHPERRQHQTAVVEIKDERVEEEEEDEEEFESHGGWIPIFFPKRAATRRMVPPPSRTSNTTTMTATTTATTDTKLMKPLRPDAITQEQINTYAYYSEILLHGTPSGIDNVVSCHGGAVLFQKQFVAAASTTSDGENNNNNNEGNTEGALPTTRATQSTTSSSSSPQSQQQQQAVTMRPLHIPSHLLREFLLVDTAVPRSTRVLVASVRRMYDTYPVLMQPLLHAIGSLSDAFCEHVATKTNTAATTTGTTMPAITSSSTLPRALDDWIDNDNHDDEENDDPVINKQKTDWIMTLIRTNQLLLQALGVSHDSLDHLVAVVDRVQRDYVTRHAMRGTAGTGSANNDVDPNGDTATEPVAVAKLTGAGGGGCAMIVIRSDVHPASAAGRNGEPSLRQAIQQALERDTIWSYRCLHSQVAGPGVLWIPDSDMPPEPITTKATPIACPASSKRQRGGGEGGGDCGGNRNIVHATLMDWYLWFDHWVLSARNSSPPPSWWWKAATAIGGASAMLMYYSHYDAAAATTSRRLQTSSLSTREPLPIRTSHRHFVATNR